MKNGSGFLILPLIVLIAGAVIWATRMPRPAQMPATTRASQPAVEPLRIGIVPERDIFAQRRRYRALADYLAAKIGRPVEIMTESSYQGVLTDFQERRVDGAFLGSLVAAMVIDQHGAKAALRPESPDHTSTYTGVLFVPDDSPIKDVNDLRGRRVAMVRTTTAGHLFPISLLHARGLLAGSVPPRIVWAGTHDEVMIEVFNGRVDAGAVKNLRLADFRKRHPEYKVRELAQSGAVPENSLVFRGDLDEALFGRVVEILRKMERDEDGRKALASLGALRFIECRNEDFDPVRKMIQGLGPVWAKSSE